ncbi:MAG: hypothetical protein KDA77_02535 [Planctomycetaceae bacterium]|nr:hypothetical protein [Planctomycetaceae bacterium]
MRDDHCKRRDGVKSKMIIVSDKKSVLEQRQRFQGQVQLLKSPLRQGSSTGGEFESNATAGRGETVP